MVADGRRVHKNALRKCRPDAKYASRGLQEYVIIQEGYFWRAKPWGYQPNYPKVLDNRFMTFEECERNLINFLKATERPGRKAIYPDG